MLSTVKKFLKYFLIFYIVLYSFVWLISPTVVRHFLGDYLKQYQLVLSDDSIIRYNPFTSHLSISDIEVTKESITDSAVFSLDSLELEVRFYQLFMEQVYVSEFTIDGLYIKVERVASNLEISGVALPSEEVDKNSEVNVEMPATEEKVEFPYKLEMPELTLKNSTIAVIVDNFPHNLRLKSFVITDFGATLAAQKLLLAIDSEVNESSLSLNISADLDKGDGDVVVDLALSKIKLARFKHFLPDDIATFEGLVSYKATHNIGLSQGNISVGFKDLSLAVEDVLVAQNNMHLGFSKQLLTSDGLSLLVKPEAMPTLEGNLAFELNNFVSYSEENTAVISSFDKLALDDISLYLENSLNKVNVANINLTNFIFSKDSTNELPPLAQFSLLNINQINASQEGVGINEINLADLAIDAQLSSEKVLLNLVSLGQDGVETSASGTEVETVPEAEVIDGSELQSEKSNTPEAAPFAIALKEVKLTSAAHIHFTDKSVEPFYERHIALNTFKSGPFDNRSPEIESLFEIIGESDKYANFAFTGFTKVFLPEPIYYLNGAFKEISLPGVSPYIKDALQYEIQSGQLDLGLEVTLVGNEIDGDADVLLRGIELKSADEHEAGNLMDQTSMPFNIALGTLKDSDGNVELNLPLSGDTSSPSFGISGFMTLMIKQATMSAAKDYLMVTFVPYASVVSIAYSAGEYALKVRFNDLEFPEKNDNLQDEHKEFLAQFSALMKDDEDLQVKLCPIATPADIGKPLGTKITSEADIKALKAISTERVHKFKDYMVEEQEIKSSRMLLCTPQINSDEEAKPAITFVT